MFEVDVRLIFASKVDLLALCREGRMLEDFYYRINDFPLTIPPLRERIEDIQLITDHYLRVYCDELDKNIVGFSDEARSILMSGQWAGNVRELEKIVKRAIILADNNGLITPTELIFDLNGGEDSDKSSRMSLPERVKDLEKRMISEALTRYSWNRKTTSDKLGISYPTLLKKIREYGLYENH
jgi:transcriptional regulator with PAS, ATPase and Fis domain